MYKFSKTKLQGMIGYALIPEGLETYPGLVALHAFNQTPESIYEITKKFAESGFLVFAPRYTDASDGVVVSVNALRSLKSFKGIDPSRVGIFGISLGGTVALLASTQEPVSFVIDVGGWVDLADLYNHLSKFPTGTPQKYIAELVKSTIGTPEESAEIYTLSSPITYVEKVTGKVLIIHGGKDTMVPVTQSQRLLEKLKEYNIEAKLEIIEDADYLFSKKEEELVRISLEFLRSHKII
ncbi:MAG: prolyl oligopeptidase family serine peptidase [Zestosphaera sp.]